MLSPQTIAIVKATVPLLREHGETITRHFYATMLNDHPELSSFFNPSHQASGTQARALAGAVLAYAANIDRLEALADALPRIVQKHAALGVRPDQYPIVGNCLLQAIRAVLGEVATDEVIAAWAEAYGELARILIDAEETVYRDRETRPGGWRGTRAFVVDRRVQESAVIESFYLRPQDGGRLLTFEPGQYLTLVLDINGETMRRNYSLSCTPNDKYYRISVKREPGGLASNFLHDHALPGTVLQVLPPCGEFVLGETSQRPLIMVSGGVGITPVLSMLKAAAPSGRRIAFIHAARNGRMHAFRDEVDVIAERHPNVSRYYIYDEPLPGDDATATGLVTTQLLADILPQDRDVDFRFLGPKPFMRNVMASARTLGIPAEMIRYEFFGPLEALDVP